MLSTLGNRPLVNLKLACGRQNFWRLRSIRTWETGKARVKCGGLLTGQVFSFLEAWNIGQDCLW